MGQGTDKEGETKDYGLNNNLDGDCYGRNGFGDGSLSSGLGIGILSFLRDF